MTQITYPQRPPTRGSQYYRMLKQEITKKDHSQKLFTVTFSAATESGGNMNNQSLDEQRFIIDLVFKPEEPKLRLRPAETQLLLSYIGEILKEIEEEEKQMIKESDTEGANKTVSET